MDSAQKSGQLGPWAQLSGAQLSGVQLCGAQLSGAQFYFSSDRNCFNCDIVARYAQYLDSLLPPSQSLDHQPGKMFQQPFRLFLIIVSLIQFLMTLS